MWVVYCYDCHEGDFGHAYFRNEEKATKYLDKMQNKWNDWVMEEIAFSDHLIED